MEVTRTNTPAEAAAHHLESLIEADERNVLCLISGGSAFAIYDHIKLSESAKGRTIFCMGDERVREGAHENNYSQLVQTCPDFVNTHQVIDTSIEDDEDPEKFSLRINRILEKIFTDKKDLKVISILGMGPDGHTAGIFPMPQDRFRDTYEADLTYVPVVVEGLTIDARASITPTFILHRVDHVIGYITGEAKQAKLNELINQDLELYDMPAQIIKQHKDAVIFTDIKI